MKPTAFDTYHPVVAFVCMSAMLVFCMCAFQPVYIATSFLAALLYSVYLRGWRAAGKSMTWQLPLIVIIAVLNPLFSAMGSTELFKIGLRAVYLESLVYGLCMGTMLVTVMLWFSNAAHVLPSDKLMALFGNVAPTISLMLSMVNRLVPKLVSRGRQVATVQETCASASAATRREGAQRRMRQTSVLMGWSMEDSLDTADAMRARGWKAGVRRTTYSRYRLCKQDAVMLVAFCLLAALNVFLAYTCCVQFAFYPKLSQLVFWWGYLPYALLVFWPLLMQAGEWLRWTL